jgi:methyl-accepting chemotaxis protein
MTEPIRRVTISFNIPPVLHLLIGAAIAAVAIVAFWVHFALPAEDEYKSTSSSIGILAGCVAAVYMVWCTTQRSRADTAALSEVTEAAIQAAAERQKTLLEAIEHATTSTLGALREVADAVAENHGAIKGLDGAVSEVADVVAEATKAVAEAVGAVEALQDCYLEEGTALVLPEPPSETI